MRTRMLTAAAGVLMLALAGCSGGDEPEQPATSASDASDSGDSGTSGSAGSGTEETSGAQDGTTPPDADLADTELPVSAQDALSTSADEVGSDGIVHAIELDYSDSAGTWVSSGKTLGCGTDDEVETDAGAGQVVEHEHESTDDQQQAVDLDAPMTFQDALAQGQDDVDGPVSGWKLQWDDGMTAYQVDIGAGS